MKQTFVYSFFLIVTLLTLNGTAYSQSGWYQQYPLMYSKSYRGVALISASTGTVVGESGTILRLTDGGMTRTNQSSGTTNNLNAVSFIDREHRDFCRRWRRYSPHNKRRSSLDKPNKRNND